MKPKFGVVWALISLMILLLTACSGLFEEDKPEKKPIPEPEPVTVQSVNTFSFSGKIVGDNKGPIPDVKIVYSGNGTSGIKFSDVNGKYSVPDVTIGTYTIKATKTGYTYGEIKFKVTENGASVPDLILSNFREIEGREETETTAADIAAQGAEVVSIVEEDVSAGGGETTMQQKEVKASIPQNTEITIDGEVVTDEIVLAVASLEVNEIPPPTNEDEVSFGAAVFEPQNATFSQPVAVTVPLEIQLPSGIQIPLQKYKDGKWVEVGTATIDESGNGADADVTEFGQFAIQPKVTLDVEEDTEPEEEVAESMDIPAEQTSFEAEVTDSVSFPGGLPQGVTVEYAISLIEKMKGSQIGVSRTVTVESPLATTAAKPARVEEEWIVTWTVEKSVKIYTETIMMTIKINGQLLEYPITYEYTVVTWEPKIQDKIVKWWIDVTVKGASGVKVTLSGSASGSVVLGDGESHRFLGDTGGSYILIPSKQGYKLMPSEIKIEKLLGDVTKTFTAEKEQNTLTLSGAVTGADEVTLALSGDLSDVAKVGVSGDSYTFSVDADKNYTVTPSKEGYTFDPPSASFTNLSSNSTADFLATKVTATISGVVDGANGVTVTLSGDASGSKVVANAGGGYSFTVNTGGNYTVSAAKEGYVMKPESVSFTDITDDIVQDLAGLKKQHRIIISGSVIGDDDVTVTLTGDATKSVTLNDGEKYFWEVDAGGTYTLTGIAAPGVLFEQGSKTYTDLQTDAGLNFVVIQYVTISGTLTRKDGTSINSVTITLSGDASDSKVVDGSYSFTVKADGLYTVTPSKSNYTFTSARFSGTVSANTTKNFRGAKWVTISGTVTGTDDVTVSLNTGDSQIVDSGGSYEFVVPAGYTYLVAATKSQYTFDVSSRTFADLNANVSQDFKVIRHSQGEIQ